MGESRFHGRFPEYELHFSDGDVGFNLVYKSETSIFMEPPDGVFIGREQTPSTPYYWGFIIMARCGVSGNLTFDGHTIPVSGKGYLEHSWFNKPNFEITFEARDIVFKTPAGIKNQRGDTKRYFRFRADCHAQLTIDEEEVEFTGPEIYEMSL